MNLIINAIGMGLLATFIMDLGSRMLVKSRLLRQHMKPEFVGRWVLYMFRGTFHHKDIQATPAIKNEVRISVLAHYLIGIALAGLFLLFWAPTTTKDIQIGPPLLFGLATTILPWFWLFPSFGYGFLASKRPHRSDYLVTSTVNHLIFGVGLTIWMVLLYPVIG